MIDGKIRQYHQLPRDYFKDWQLIYNIKRTSNAPKKYVSNLLRFPDTKISQRLKKVHQLYEKIGSIRKSHGKKKTKNHKCIIPNSSFDKSKSYYIL